MSQDTVTTQTGAWAMIPVWILGKGLTGAELAVYVSLRSFADRSGDAHPHVKTIAERGGVSERTAERAIAVLRSKGLIKTTRRYADAGTQLQIIGCDYHLIDVEPAVSASDVATPGATESPPPDEAVATPPDEAVATPPTRLSEQEHTNRTHHREERALDPGAKPPPDNPNGAAEKPKRRARGSPPTPPPDFFPVTDDHRAWAAREGITADLERETRQWLDYHRAKGTNDVKDWTASWRTWMRNTLKYAPATARVPGGLGVLFEQ